MHVRIHLRAVRIRAVRAAGAVFQCARAAALALSFLAALAAEGRAQTADNNLTREQLEQLVAPIALYPDALLAQVLMASTYPLEIVQAARWAAANSKLNGGALEGALQTQPWDSSVKSIVVVPQVLQMMNDKLDWTELLGNAFLAQQEDLLSAVQDLRARADANGMLKTTNQQKVSKQTVSTAPAAGAPAGGAPASGSTNVIVIEPANPQVIYVPTYNPSFVYGAWPYPSYPPYYWYPPGYVASNLISFGAGVAVGAAIWGNCNWGRNQVNINVNNFNSFNRTNITNANWQHNAAHRKGVPYANSGVAQRFGQNVGGGASAARDQFRGRAESGQSNLGNQNLQNRLGGQNAGQNLGQNAGQGLSQRIGNQAPGQGLADRRGGAGQDAGRDRAANARNTAAGNLQNRAAGGGAGGGVKALDGLGRGQSIRAESARGAASRNAMASAIGGPGSGGSGRLGGAGAGSPRGGGGAIGGGARGVRGGRRGDLWLEPGIVPLAPRSG